MHTTTTAPATTITVWETRVRYKGTAYTVTGLTTWGRSGQAVQLHSRPMVGGGKRPEWVKLSDVEVL